MDGASLTARKVLILNPEKIAVAWRIRKIPPRQRVERIKAHDALIAAVG